MSEKSVSGDEGSESKSGWVEDVWDAWGVNSRVKASKRRLLGDCGGGVGGRCVKGW